MDACWLELLEQGYVIRKLNQAYFAFHGSYAVGTSATDPIGGKLRSLRLAPDPCRSSCESLRGSTMWLTWTQP